jgi:predicted enzyme related to lactoylglutathione lyase
METVEETNYSMWHTHDGPGVGFTPLDENIQPGDVIIHINSDDIEADLKKAKSLGAMIVSPKSEIPYTGWYCMFKDHTGNTIALYTSMNPEFNA